MLLRTLTAVLLLLVCGAAGTNSSAQEIRPGVWAGSRVDALSLPTAGYQVYLVGELHGIQENAAFQVAYLELLNRLSSVRDVAIEEKSAFENQAQAYIDGDSEAPPPALCLRASLLRGIRDLNAPLGRDKRIRVHLVDIDSPASAIREHLLLIKSLIPEAAEVKVASADEMKKRGPDTVRALKNFRSDAHIKAELRTVAYSIRAYQEGFEVATGPAAGSPYLEEREQAVADNIADLVPGGPLLVILGGDHVSRSLRKDGGPERNQPFLPMAARLEKSGVKFFSVASFPLAGQSFWRGSRSDLMWQPEDGHLASGETLDKVLAAAPNARFVYIDRSQEHVRLPSQDISNYKVDGFVLFPSGEAMRNECQAMDR